MYKNDIFTVIANLCGIPAISIPAALSSNNLPLGLQILSPLYKESIMLNFAKQLESSIDINFTPKGY